MLRLCFSLLQFLLSPLLRATLMLYHSVFLHPLSFQMKPDFFHAQDGKIPLLGVTLQSSLLPAGCLHPWLWDLERSVPNESQDCRREKDGHVVKTPQCLPGRPDWFGLYLLSPGALRLRQNKLLTADHWRFRVHLRRPQTGRSADLAKRHIWRHWKVYFHNKKNKSFQVLWAFKKAYKIRECDNFSFKSLCTSFYYL